jgi:hypothetical protein
MATVPRPSSEESRSLGASLAPSPRCFAGRGRGKGPLSANPLVSCRASVSEAIQGPEESLDCFVALLLATTVRIGRVYELFSPDITGPKRSQVSPLKRII